MTAHQRRWGLNVDENARLEEICKDFLKQLDAGNQPSIEDALKTVEEDMRVPLLAALLRVEIVYRQKDGQEVFASDYDQFGSGIVSSAIEFASSKAGHSVDSDGSLDASFTMNLPTHQSDDSVSKEDSTGIDLSLVKKSVRQIGRYRLLQQIGLGGMGEVWLADQTEPVKRRVALKLIKVGIDSRNAVARFEAERQAIAMMDHVNIAKILDAGTSESGQPYFVMELVNGVPLNQYCDRNRLSIRKRLELMIPVCRAVQHAHQKGIIHRDLKHSNVLVSEYDGQPVPKVIDFGLAKALGHHDTLTEKTMFTEFGSIVGTLNYMSPEQAENSSEDVDTRSDVYSLGIMLYKLLIGKTPLELEVNPDATLLTKLRELHDKDPVRPSQRVLKNEDLQDTVSELRNTSTQEIQADLTGELDWIVLKAIAKNRNERYQTANGLALELERFLNNEKVLARPASTWYLLRKFVKRNKGLVASLATIVGLLVAGILGTTLASIWALEQRDIAAEESRIAGVEQRKAINAENAAKESQAATEREKKLREVQLYALKLKSSWSDWRLGNTETAWQLLNESMELNSGWEADFLNSQYSSSRAVLFGHSRGVASVDVSSDGKYIASGADDNSVRIWDAKEYKLKRRLLFEDSVTCVRFSPNSQLLACADRSNVVSIFNMVGEQVNKLGPFANDAMALEFLPDGKSVIVGSSVDDSRRTGSERDYHESPDVFCRIIDLESKDVVHEFQDVPDEVSAISVSGNAETVVVSCRDGSVSVWKKSREKFELHERIECHLSGVSDLDLSKDGSLMVTCGNDEAIALWEVETGLKTRSFLGHKGGAASVAFNESDTQVTSCGKDGTVRVWALSGQALETFKGHFSRVFDAAFVPGGDELVSASYDRTVRVWSRHSKPGETSIDAHSDIVWTADFSADGSLVASGSEDGTIAVFDANTKQLVQSLTIEPAVLSIQFSPDGALLVAGCGDQHLRVWNVEDWSLAEQIEASESRMGFVWEIDFSSDGELLATGSADSSLKIWDTKTWEVIRQTKAHDSEVASVRFSKDGKILLTASDDSTAKLWNVDDLSLLKVLEGHNHSVWRARFSPDGKRIATCAYDGEVIFWDSKTCEIAKRLAAHSNQIAGMDFSKDSKRLVTASDDYTIKIWDMETFTELFVLRDAGKTEIVHVSFSDDGNQLVTGNKGFLTIRDKGNPFRSSMLLPLESRKLTIKGLELAVSGTASVPEFEKELVNAKRCCEFYPEYTTHTFLGVVQYRLGNFREAIEPLVEALRSEPFEYGQGDSPPFIEAFLAMSHWRTGQAEEARRYRLQFEEIVSGPQWKSDLRLQKLRQEVNEVFEGQSNSGKAH